MDPLRARFKEEGTVLCGRRTCRGVLGELTKDELAIPEGFELEEVDLFHLARRALAKQNV